MFETLKPLWGLIIGRFHNDILKVISYSVVISIFELVIIVIVADCLSAMYSRARTLNILTVNQELMLGLLCVVITYILWWILHKKTAWLGWTIGNFVTTSLIFETYKKYDNRSYFAEDDILNLTIVESMRLTHAVIVPLIVMASRLLTTALLLLASTMILGPTIIILLAFVSFISFVYRLVTFKKLQIMGEKITSYGRERVAGINRLVKNRRELSLFEAETRAIAMLERSCNSIANNQAATFQISNGARNFIEGVIYLTLMMFVFLGHTSFIDPITLVAFLKIAPNIYQAAQLYNTAQANIGSAEKLTQFFELLGQIKDKQPSRNLYDGEFLIEISESSWWVGARQVNVPAFSIAEHDSILISGQSGSGKSSLLDILAGIREPQSEFFNKRDSLKLSMASQVPCFIEGTVLENMEFFCPDFSPEKLERLQNRLFATDSGILEKNIKVLSGGELARVSAIRCMIREADIYIFDEITASLDRQNALNLISVIKEELEEQATIFIMHKDRHILDFTKVIEITRA